MYDQAIKIDPKYAPAFSNKGFNFIENIKITRKSAQETTEILRSH